MRPLDGADLLGRRRGAVLDRLRALRLRVEGGLEVLEHERVVQDVDVGRGLRAGDAAAQQQRAAGSRRDADEEPPAREARAGLRERPVAVESCEVETEVGAHAVTPIRCSACRTCASVLGESTASGAGSRSAMLRIQAACRASTETIRAATRNASGPTLPA